ncbi:MAG: ribonuclease HI family protein [Terracidiphilus sp.]|jgi:probable phosphoglycerate mutase
MTGNLFASPDPSTDPTPWYTAHCDGGSRGNPGPSGYGAVIEDANGRVVAELSEFLGIQTNNFAEYRGLLGVLKWATQNRIQRLRVVSDSELMVKQMQGKYKVASPILRPLYDEARKLARALERFEMTHTLRGGNKTADRLANEAMDKGMGKTASQQASGSASQQAARPYGKLATTAENRVPPVSTQRPGNQPTPPVKPPRQILEGYVKGGVVHLLEGDLPDGIFVKIIRE